MKNNLRYGIRIPFFVQGKYQFVSKHRTLEAAEKACRRWNRMSNYCASIIDVETGKFV
jgi:hypothetical protein